MVRHQGAPLATDVEIARSLPARMARLMFRRSVPEDFALVFPFETGGRRSVAMVFGPTPIDVLWGTHNQVTWRSTLTPWTGFGRRFANTVIELAPRAAGGVADGDRVTVAASD